MRGFPEFRGLPFRRIGLTAVVCTWMVACASSDSAEGENWQDAFYDVRSPQSDAKRGWDVVSMDGPLVTINSLCGVGSCDPGNEQACVPVRDSAVPLPADPGLGGGGTGGQRMGGGGAGAVTGAGGSASGAGAGGAGIAAGAGGHTNAGGLGLAGASTGGIVGNGSGGSLVVDASVGGAGPADAGADVASSDGGWLDVSGGGGASGGGVVAADASTSPLDAGLSEEGSFNPVQDARPSDGSGVVDASQADAFDIADVAPRDSGMARDAAKDGPSEGSSVTERSPFTPLACHVRIDVTSVVRNCEPAGSGKSGDPCDDSSECMAGLGCVQSNGLTAERAATCRPFACTPPCPEGTFYDEVPLRDHGHTLFSHPVPVCNEADGCELLSDKSCITGRVCTVVGQGTTTCLPPGTAQRDQPCDSETRCAAGLVCAKSTNRCLRLCRTDSNDCTGGACQGGSQQLPSGFGVCVGDVADADAKTQAVK